MNSLADIYPTIEEFASNSHKIIQSQDSIEHLLVEEKEYLTEKINSVNNNIDLLENNTSPKYSQNNPLNNKNINEIKDNIASNKKLSEQINQSIADFSTKVDKKIDSDFNHVKDLKYDISNSFKQLDTTIKSETESLKTVNNDNYKLLQDDIKETTHRIDSTLTKTKEIKQSLLALRNKTDEKINSDFYCIKEFKQSLSNLTEQLEVFRQDTASKNDLEAIIMFKAKGIEALINEKHHETNQLLLQTGNRTIANVKGIDEKIKFSYAQSHNHLTGLLNNIETSIGNLGNTSKQSTNGLTQLINNIDKKSEAIKAKIVNSYAEVEQKIITETDSLKTHNTKKSFEIQDIIQNNKKSTIMHLGIDMFYLLVIFSILFIVWVLL